MKVHSLTILHYGKDYLSYALKSVYPYVDACHVFYTPTPSHGYQTDTPPIETKEELMAAAYAHNPDDKIRWYDMLGARQEGPQRDTALQTVQGAGADIVVVLDYDEVWDPVVLQSMLIEVIEKNTVRHWLVNMIHFWRSFNWACYDNGWPVRIIDLRNSSRTDSLSQELGRVYHFGYAITDRVMRYKWQIHGHKSELRHNWLNDKWSRWPPPDNCHPTNGRNEQGQPFWTPQPFDRNGLPGFMKSHPFYNLEKIE